MVFIGLAAFALLTLGMKVAAALKVRRLARLGLEVDL